LNAVFSTKLAVGAPAENPPAVRDLGVALMTSHVIPLEIIGLLLTVALLGAVVLALPERAPELEGQGGTST